MGAWSPTQCPKLRSSIFILSLEIGLPARTRIAPTIGLSRGTVLCLEICSFVLGTAVLHKVAFLLRTVLSFGTTLSLKIALSLGIALLLEINFLLGIPETLLRDHDETYSNPDGLLRVVIPRDYYESKARFFFCGVTFKSKE